MRRLAIFICLTLCLTAPAAAQERARPTTSTYVPARLRGAISTPARPPARPAQVSRMVPLAPTTIPAPLARLTQPADPARCRADCDRNYYFCSAADAPDSCSPGWGQCRALCAAPRYAVRRTGGP